MQSLRVWRRKFFVILERFFELQGELIAGFQRTMAYWKGLCKDNKIYLMTFSMRIQIKSQESADDFHNNFQISATPTKFLLCILQEKVFPTSWVRLP